MVMMMMMVMMVPMMVAMMVVTKWLEVLEVLQGRGVGGVAPHIPALNENLPVPELISLTLCVWSRCSRVIGED